MTRQAIIYARISRDREGGGLGVARQIEDCRALAEHLGWDVLDVIEDNDISAYSGKVRPGYQRLLAELRAGRANAVVAWHTDRLHRHPLELEEYISICEAHHVATHTVKAGDIDLSTETGQAIARTLGAWAKQESGQKGERIRRQKRQAAEAGKYRGGARPYGYERDGTTIREDEAAVVRHVATELLAGRSLGSLVREANERGAVTPAGKPWNQVAMRLMLLRARNAGLIEHNKEIVGKAQWEPLIPQGQWLAVVALLKDPRRRTNFAGPEPKYLLSGIARCGVCEDKMVVVTSGNGRRAYSCRASRGHVSRLQDRVDLLIRGVMVERLSQEDVASLLAQDDDSEARLEAARAKIAEQTTLLDEMGVMFMRKQITRGALTAATAEGEAEIAKAQAIIDAATAGNDLSWLAKAPDPAQAWLDAPLDKARTVVDALLSVKVLRAPRGVRSGPVADRKYIEMEWKR